MSKSNKQREIVAHLFAHPKYSQILEKIKTRYLKDNKPDYLDVPYILMCATTLEAKLNDELHNYAVKLWKDEFATIANSYMSMSFKSKLNSLVPILTDNQFRINQDHFVYKCLASLIKVRNKLVHPKTSIKTFKIKDSKIKFPFGLNLPQEYYENVGIQSLV